MLWALICEEITSSPSFFSHFVQLGFLNANFDSHQLGSEFEAVAWRFEVLDPEPMEMS